MLDTNAHLIVSELSYVKHALKFEAMALLKGLEKEKQGSSLFFKIIFQFYLKLLSFLKACAISLAKIIANSVFNLVHLHRFLNLGVFFLSSKRILSKVKHEI